MRLRKNDISSFTVLYPLTILALAVGAMLFFIKPEAAKAGSTVNVTTNTVVSSPAATFNADAASLGAIPDGLAACAPSPGAPRNVTFTVSGLSGPVTTVDVSMTFGSPAHTFMGDVVAVLIAPNGASHTVFGRTGSTTATGFGDGTDLAGPYVFSDIAPSPPSGGWWQESTVQSSTVAMTSGTYRTTQSGGAGTPNPAPATTMNAAFTGVTNANGTWTLRLTDGCAVDTGAVSAAVLTVVTAPVTPNDVNADFNGDGRTDFIVSRATSSPFAEPISDDKFGTSDAAPPREEVKGRQKHLVTDPSLVPQAPPIYWYTSINGTGVTSVAQLGDAATDFIVTEDFDGDLKDDLVVWTEAAANSANFKILRSSSSTVLVSTFGQTGDDPAVVGDYDGDGKADVAVYRCPDISAPAGQCFFFFRGSLNNPNENITYVPWGSGNDGDNFPYVGDFDGDGKNDFCIQRANPSNPTAGQFALLKSGGGNEFILWGLSSDFLIPGDYDGDGKTDFCVRRTVSGSRQHFILTRTGATTSALAWGITGDTSVPGDYDGDGKTDLAIWRGSATAGASTFWVRNSSNNSVSQFLWGSCPVGNCDFPVAGWAVH